jgi:multidrug efflux pump
VSQFFIGRPICLVIAIIIMVAGAVAYAVAGVHVPGTCAPTVSICVPSGASAKVVEDSVTQVIEQNMKGLDGLIYMSATSESTGSASVTLTFENGVDPDIAQVQVQNKLQLSMPLLPPEVQRQGVSVSKAGSAFLMVIGFVSEDGRMTKDDIADYVSASIVDPISRIHGVGNLQVFGSQYAMRIWLDPNLLRFQARPATSTAVQAENQQWRSANSGGCRGNSSTRRSRRRALNGRGVPRHRRAQQSGRVCSEACRCRPGRAWRGRLRLCLALQPADGQRPGGHARDRRQCAGNRQSRRIPAGRA